MSRLSYAIAVPCLLGAICVLAFAEIVVSGFHGEGCRFGASQVSRSAAGTEWLYLQAAALVPFALLLWGLAKTIAEYEPLGHQRALLARLIIGFALIAFAAFTAHHWIYSTTCNSGSWTVALGPLRWTTYAASAAVAAIVLMAYARGLIATSQDQAGR